MKKTPPSKKPATTVDELVSNTHALPRSNAMGQFATANQNPYPVPRDYRAGLQEKVDIVHPEKTKR